MFFEILYDISDVARRKKLIDYEQIIDYFTYPYRAKEDIKERIATCAALYAFSSPPITNEVGGVNTAVLSKKTHWDAFKKPMKIIPDEFFTINSKFFYCISEKEKIYPQTNSDEINLAFLRPEKLMADIPIVIENLSLKGISRIEKDDIEDRKKFITSYLLDSLIIAPNPMESIEKIVTNAVYDIRDEYLRSGISPYRQNLGDAVPKLTASISRLHLDPFPKSEHVKKVVDLWKEMHRKVKHRMGDSLPISKYYELSDNTRMLYTELHDTYGKEYSIPLQDVLKITSLKNDSDFNHALNELVERGHAIRDRKGIKLLEKWG